MPDGSTLSTKSAATFHPCADVFPLMEGADFDALVADIKANGLREPIVEIDSAILDGRNRYRACNEAGVVVRTEKYTGKDPLAYVLSANLHRRHLNESQRAMVAAKLATAPEGRPPKTTAIAVVSQDQAARLLHVAADSVQRAKKVREKGTPRLVQRVEQGEVAVSLAAKVAELPSKVQRQLQDADEAVLRGATKKERRARRERDLGDKTRQAAADLGTKVYGVLYADPPWRFEPYSRETGMDRAADNHYPTLTVDGIRDLQAPAAEDAVLFLWATAPMLREALAVMEAWDFEYKSHVIWAKDRIGTGYWARNKHELLLIGTRGKVPAPAPGDQFESVIHAKVGKHSEKPAAFAEMIEEMFPNLPAVEMFARAPRLGWDTWGNEVSA